MSKVKIGVPSDNYTCRNDLHTSAKLLKAHGYDCIDYSDFCDTSTQFFCQSEEDFHAELKKIKEIYASEGIWINQTHAPWCWPPPDETEQKRQIRLEEMKKAVRGSATLGAKNFVVHPLMPFGPDSDENPQQMKAINTHFISELIKEGEKYGVIICLENMPFKHLPISSTDQIIEFVKGFNSPYLKICLDTGHSMLWNEQPSVAVQKIGKDLLSALHIHDNDGTRDGHQPLYTGVIDWQAFKTALEEIGYDGVYSLETSFRLESVVNGENEDFGQQLRQLIEN